MFQRLGIFRTLIQSVDLQLAPLTQALVAQAGKVRPLVLGPRMQASATNEVGNWQRFANRKPVGSLTGLCGGISSSGLSQHMALQ